jgi:hypothetical protein
MAMAETVKIGEEQKRRLEKYLARLLIEHDRKIPFQEALGQAVDHAISDERFTRKLLGGAPLEEDYAWRMLEKPKKMGIRDLSRDIDKWVYGGG